MAAPGPDTIKSGSSRYKSQASSGCLPGQVAQFSTTAVLLRRKNLGITLGSARKAGGEKLQFLIFIEFFQWLINLENKR
jgi:hypothetical protein